MNNPTVSERIQLLTRLKEYLRSDEDSLNHIKEQTYLNNNWFTITNINTAVNNICNEFLDQEKLEKWISTYPAILRHPDNSYKTVGIVMAGNIPLVGFHDFLCVFIAGFSMTLKLSSRDTVFWKHIIGKITEWAPAYAQTITFADLLKGCDIYIATGSNNTSRYFEAYFGKYPHIIRKNRTSVAVLTGEEPETALEQLVEDISQYYGMGCRNVSKVYLPESYNPELLLRALATKDEFMLNHRYKNNYDYHLAVYMLNKVKYLTNDSMLLVESTEPFAPVATLHYEYFRAEQMEDLMTRLEEDDRIQAILTARHNNTYSKSVMMGDSQSPGLSDYADGVDTMQFLSAQIID